jgi:hypothetical protein
MNPEASEWIEWKGGKRPVRPTALVRVRFRDGIETQRALRAVEFLWDHGSPPDCDIIAYLVVKP